MKRTKQERDGYYTMIRAAIHQEYLKLINLSAANEKKATANRFEERYQ